MSATKVGIVYSIALNAVRCVYVFDDDDEPRPKLQPGEGYIEHSAEEYHTDTGEQVARGARAALVKFTGREPQSDRCAQVHAVSQLVVAHIKADPAIDQLDGHILILHDKTIEGDKHIGNGKFTRNGAHI